VFFGIFFLSVFTLADIHAGGRVFWLAFFSYSSKNSLYMNINFYIFPPWPQEKQKVLSLSLGLLRE